MRPLTLPQKNSISSCVKWGKFPLDIIVVKRVKEHNGYNASSTVSGMQTDYENSAPIPLFKLGGNHIAE